MTRRRVTTAPSLRASNDRWLFGYADVVTLLFACFASLYATRVVPAEAALASAAGRGRDVSLPAEAAAAPATGARDDALARQISAVVDREGTMPGLEVASTVRGLVVSLPEAGSFPPGRAELSEAARATMRDLAGRLQAIPNQVRVEGHTDDTPIRTALFASNWELSTARATRVVQFLIDVCGLDPTRLSAAGYGAHRPRLANVDALARARNRRVDIVILDDQAARGEPGGPQ